MPLIINSLLCAALFYTCFCRLVRTDRDTRYGVRISFVVLASIATICFVAPFLSAYRPGWPALLMNGGIVFVQAVTARYWRDGVPSHFQRCPCPHEGHP